MWVEQRKKNWPSKKRISDKQDATDIKEEIGVGVEKKTITSAHREQYSDLEKKLRKKLTLIVSQLGRGDKRNDKRNNRKGKWQDKRGEQGDQR